MAAGTPCYAGDMSNQSGRTVIVVGGGIAGSAISRELANAGHRVLVFAKKNGRLATDIALEFCLKNLAIKSIENYSQKDISETKSALCLYSDRETETELTCNLFKKFDFFVSPSHERTNWALGLGLPMIILEPAIGPFSPLNQEILLESGVAESLNSTEDANRLGKTLKVLKNSRKLQQMSESGWGKQAITGFQVIADFLVNKFA